MRPTSPGGFGMSDGVDAIDVSGDGGGDLIGPSVGLFSNFFWNTPLMA